MDAVVVTAMSEDKHCMTLSVQKVKVSYIPLQGLEQLL